MPEVMKGWNDDGRVQQHHDTQEKSRDERFPEAAWLWSAVHLQLVCILSLGGFESNDFHLNAQNFCRRP